MFTARVTSICASVSGLPTSRTIRSTSSSAACSTAPAACVSAVARTVACLPAHSFAASRAVVNAEAHRLSSAAGSSTTTSSRSWGDRLVTVAALNAYLRALPLYAMTKRASSEAPVVETGTAAPLARGRPGLPRGSPGGGCPSAQLCTDAKHVAFCPLVGLRGGHRTERPLARWRRVTRGGGRRRPVHDDGDVVHLGVLASLRRQRLRGDARARTGHGLRRGGHGADHDDRRGRMAADARAGRGERRPAAGLGRAALHRRRDRLLALLGHGLELDPDGRHA